MGAYQFNQPSLMIRDPELIKELTVRDFDHFTDHKSVGDSEFDAIWSRNLFALKGKYVKVISSIP